MGAMEHGVQISAQEMPVANKHLSTRWQNPQHRRKRPAPNTSRIHWIIPEILQIRERHQYPSTGSIENSKQTRWKKKLRDVKMSKIRRKENHLKSCKGKMATHLQRQKQQNSTRHLTGHPQSQEHSEWDIQVPKANNCQPWLLDPTKITF